MTRFQTSALLGAAALTALLISVAMATPSSSSEPLAPETTSLSTAAPAELASPVESPTALTNPVTFADCMGGGEDCCNPKCKPYISGCCAKNSCGLPVQSQITGKGPWAGQTLSCGNLVD